MLHRRSFLTKTLAALGVLVTPRWLRAAPLSPPVPLPFAAQIADLRAQGKTEGLLWYLIRRPNQAEPAAIHVESCAWSERVSNAKGVWLPYTPSAETAACLLSASGYRQIRELVGLSGGCYLMPEELSAVPVLVYARPGTRT